MKANRQGERLVTLAQLHAILCGLCVGLISQFITLEGDKVSELHVLAMHCFCIGLGTNLAFYLLEMDPNSPKFTSGFPRFVALAAFSATYLSPLLGLVYLVSRISEKASSLLLMIGMCLSFYQLHMEKRKVEEAVEMVKLLVANILSFRTEVMSIEEDLRKSAANMDLDRDGFQESILKARPGLARLRERMEVEVLRSEEAHKLCTESEWFTPKVTIQNRPDINAVIRDFRVQITGEFEKCIRLAEESWANTSGVNLESKLI